MKPLFGGGRTSSDERNELAKLRLYVKQLEARVDSGVSSSYEEESKVENLLKVFTIFPCVFTIFPCVFMIFPCVLTIFPCVFMIFPCVFTIFPCVFTIFPCVFTIFPCVFTIFPCIFIQYFLVFRISRLDCDADKTVFGVRMKESVDLKFCLNRSNKLITL